VTGTSSEVARILIQAVSPCLKVPLRHSCAKTGENHK
jgi:hypothetical protein